VDAPGPWTLIYDGDCEICRRSVTALVAWDRDRAFECLPYQDAGVTARFPALDPRALRDAVHLVGADGRVWAGAAAVEQAARLLPRARALAWLFRLPFAGALADRAYRAIARHRHRFGCREHCRAASRATRPPG
jgi:predicted DCC family thiol-disulfide oxidoreductase YuxK